jgi:LacI family transcriptional regulator
MITIKDIARVAGVAASTVARALADHPHVHEATKARIRKEAARLGYVAHAPARAMRGGHSGLIGLMIPDIRNDFYSTAAQAISEACAATGLQVVLSITDEDPARERELLRSLVSARCAGVIVVPTARPMRDSLALLQKIPHVQLIRRARSVRAPWFGIDDAAATRIAALHLLGLGHRRIAYVGGDLALSTGAERFRGFQEALKAWRVAPRPELYAHGPADAQSGAAGTRAVLSASPAPSALVLAGSRLTVGALDAVRELGLEVPRELSVVGFNDSAGLGWWGKGATSVGLPVRDIAAACAAGLIGAVRAPNADPGTTSTRPAAAAFEPFLIERGSTAPVADARKRAA